jgi:hypothetical protein
MGEILGFGCTHYPGLTVSDERLPASFHRLRTAPGVLDMSEKCVVSYQA